MTSESEIEIENEFAAVSVRLDPDGTSGRLLVRDLRSGNEVRLDPLQLESLVWIGPELWRAIVDPANARWGEPEPGPTPGEAQARTGKS